MANSGYAPNENGWSKSDNTVGTGYVRLYYSTSYKASDNTSTVTVQPQFKITSSAGGDYRYYDTTGGNGGIWGGGSKIYTLSTSFGGQQELRAGNATNIWAELKPSSGSISTFTVTHNNNGDATFNIAIYGGIHYFWGNGGTLTPLGSSSGTNITIHENAPYAISYNANGGSGAPSSQSIYAGVSYNLSTTQPTRTGYNFLGWSTDSSATTASYVAGQSVTPNGNLALYAVWQKQSFTLSISQGTGSTISVKRNNVSLSNGDTIYYGDVLAISISANTGYNIGTHTVNGSNWTSGNYTVAGAVSVISTATLIQYTLSVTTSPNGVTTNIQRLTSPIGGGSTGTITNGAILYYNDTLAIGYTVGGAYELLTATVNNVDISEQALPYNVTVNSNIIVNVTVKLGAIIYIANEAYQIFIGDGTNWNQYQAFIGNGADFEQY